jgi:class 3 adenylate cyclase
LVEVAAAQPQPPAAATSVERSIVPNGQEEVQIPPVATRHRHHFDVFGLFKHYIMGKIIVPYMVLIIILGTGAIYVVQNLVAGSLEDKFREELATAGRSANEAMVKIESGQLTVLRQMAFTVGVDDAIIQNDAANLQRLLAPIAANAQVPYVDVFANTGIQVFAVRAPDLGTDAATRLDPDARNWLPVRSVIAGIVDDRGDKHASVVYPSWGGAILTSAAPVEKDGVRVGIIAISVPVDGPLGLAARLSADAGSKPITLYKPDGQLVTSTVAASPAVLSAALAVQPEMAGTLTKGDQVIVRKASLEGRNFVETLGVLQVRREPVLLLGVGNLLTIIEDSGAETRKQLILIFLGVIFVVLISGVLIARSITRPIEALVDATHRIRQNELDFELTTKSEDETGILVEAFNEMTGGLRERERSRVAITKYMSQKVYKLIQSGELGMGGVVRDITVFDTDIRSFTSISETKTPDALIAFLNRYFTPMVAAIYKYEGEVDKFVGDAILAKFGATEWYPDHAVKACMAMIEMIEACDALDEELEKEGDWIIRMGIGCNTGLATIGNLGSPERMEYTIISDVVNTAARAQELTKDFGWDLLISETTYEAAKDYIEVGEPFVIQLRGQSRDTYLYPLLGRKGDVSEKRMELYRDLKATGRSIFADFYEAAGLVPVSTS